MKHVLQKSGKSILLGNEAIVRGALEAGVQFVATYPGTPSSEVGIVFSAIAKDRGVYFEYSTNEKVALEAVIGASFSGLKSLCAMKNFGLNVASDALLPFLYTGTGPKGPTVIIVADDPSCHSSAQSEENSRGFAQLAHIPILEPSDPQECKDFVKLGFEISAKFNLPVMVRETTRVAHQKMPVRLGRLKQTDKGAVGSKPVGKFVKDKHRFVTMPPRVMEQHQELLDKIEKIKALAEKSSINKIVRDPISNSARERDSGAGIITSGVSYLYVREALQELKINLPVLKLGFFYPLPEKRIQAFIKPLKKVLVIEELEPFLEKEIGRLAKDVNPKLKVLGKDVLPEIGELTPDKVLAAAAKLTGKKIASVKKPPFKIIKHLPRFCTVPACPYWKLFAAVRQAVPDSEAVFGGDIGCYMIAALKPHNLYDYVSCMGSSAGIAHGVAKAIESRPASAKAAAGRPARNVAHSAAGGQKAIAFMGDSTFFHAGIPAVINAVFNKSNPLLIISDNRITAMTGHQPNPGTGRTGMGEVSPEIKIADIAKACGVKYVKVLDPEEQFAEMVKTIKEFVKLDDVSVIVSRRICALLAKRQKK